MAAPDERHVKGQTGEIILARNKIVKPLAGDGVVIQDVTDARVIVEDNRVERADLALGGQHAILLTRFQNATVEVRDNWLGPYKYGIRAQAFDENTTWVVGENSATGVEFPVYWDESVAHPPEGASGDGHAHDHGGHEADAAAPAMLRRLGL
jgi:hypothetical protein